MIYESIYKKLIKLGVIELVGNKQNYSKSELPNYMPLSFDKVFENDSVTVIALAHRYPQNGDLMADPDCEIAIHQNGMAECLTYQQDNLGIYQQVYDTFPNPKQMKTRLKKELNCFLNQWLTNCLNQGHKFDV